MNKILVLALVLMAFTLVGCGIGRLNVGGTDVWRREDASVRVLVKNNIPGEAVLKNPTVSGRKVRSENPDDPIELAFGEEVSLPTGYYGRRMKVEIKFDVYDKAGPDGKYIDVVRMFIRIDGDGYGRHGYGQHSMESPQTLIISEFDRAASREGAGR